MRLTLGDAYADVCLEYVEGCRQVVILDYNPGTVSEDVFENYISSELASLY